MGFLAKAAQLKTVQRSRLVVVFFVVVVVVVTDEQLCFNSSLTSGSVGSVFPLTPTRVDHSPFPSLLQTRTAHPSTVFNLTLAFLSLSPPEPSFHTLLLLTYLHFLSASHPLSKLLSSSHLCDFSFCLFVSPLYVMASALHFSFCCNPLIVFNLRFPLPPMRKPP